MENIIINNNNLPAYFNQYNYNTKFTAKAAFTKEATVLNTEIYCNIKDYVIEYPKDKDYFRFVSYNIHNFHNVCITNDLITKKDPKYALDIIQKLNPDVVFFQEYIPYPKKYNKMIDSKKTIFDVDFNNVDSRMSTINNMSHSIKTNDFNHIPNIFMGKAIYSNKVISNPSVLDLGTTPDRTILLCKITYETKIINLVNVHLSYGNITTTSEEMTTLFNILSRIDPSEITIIMGDFNNNISFYEFEAVFLKSITPLGYRLLSTTNDMTGFNQDEKIDFVFVSQNFDDLFEIKLYNGCESIVYYADASDHYPIFFDFKLKTIKTRSEDYNRLTNSMISYYYIYYKNNADKYLSDEEHNRVIDVMYKYSYPCCMNINNDITSDEKHSIITDEYEFIKNKIKEINTEIIVIQIPRTIYDLYNLYFTGDLHKINTNILNITFDLSKSYKLYSDLLYRFQEDPEYRKYIKELNDDIIDDIYNYIDYMDTDYYYELLNYIIYKIVNNDDNNIDYRIKSNLLQNKQYLLNILNFELNIYGKYTKNQQLLFRVVEDNSSNIPDSVIDSRLKSIKKSYSLSYNNAVLNGIVYDPTACTFDYRSNFLRKATNDMNSYIDNYYTGKIFPIEKHFYGDNNDAYHLFFIPPLHPFFQIYIDESENWHPRTKIGNDSVLTELRRFNPMLTITGSDFDYLRSSKTVEELETIFKKYTQPKNIMYFTKYNKIKNMLKNKISKYDMKIKIYIKSANII